MKLAAQLFTVRDFTNTDTEVRETLAKIRRIGYQAVQISALRAYNVKNIVQGLQENGLEVCVTHTPLGRILGETEKVIDEHKLFGAKYVGLGYFYGNRIEEYSDLLDTLSPAIEKINNAGLKFLYHNHSHEFKNYGGIKPIDLLIEKSKTGCMGLLPDLHWLQKAGVSPEKFIRDHKGITPVVHFKDMRVPLDEYASSITEIFAGNMDYTGIYEACVETGVEWAAIEQDTCDGNPFDSLKKSFDNLQKHGLFIGK